ncbi:FAD-dependent monooxygenase [Nocardiopsis listeri]|uniref:FAD-dependent monooxygenase n=1 Tax=Nocardiopsis listeri TaxID=53440 RepID=UPI0012EE0950
MGLRPLGAGADRDRRGRSLLAGNAAHTHFPAGGQGRATSVSRARSTWAGADLDDPVLARHAFAAPNLSPMWVLSEVRPPGRCTGNVRLHPGRRR